MAPRKPVPCPIAFPVPRRPVSDESVARAVAHLLDQYQDFLLRKMEDARDEVIEDKANPVKLMIDKLLKMDSDPSLARRIHLKEASETKMGDLLEQVALMINIEAFGGQKSSAEGLDIEFKDTASATRYLVACKSGDKWANSDSSQKLADNFHAAERRINTSSTKDSRDHLVFVNGCVYGNNSRDKLNKTYYRVAGADYWHFISGDPTMLDRITAEMRRQLGEVSPIDIDA